MANVTRQGCIAAEINGRIVVGRVMAMCGEVVERVLLFRFVVVMVQR